MLCCLLTNGQRLVISPNGIVEIIKDEGEVNGFRGQSDKIERSAIQ